MAKDAEVPKNTIIKTYATATDEVWEIIMIKIPML